MKRHAWLGLGMMLGLAALTAPTETLAQSVADVVAVQTAIKSELARPGSGIEPNAVHVSNVRFEGVFATADVAGSNFDAPIVFVKQAESVWKVVMVGIEKTPADCQHVGFPPGSQMCPN